MARSGCSLLSATASRTTPPVTMRLVLVRMPPTWQSTMPRFTPSDAPKSSALTIRNRSMPSGKPHVGEQPGGHAARLEEFLGKRARRAAMPLVVGIHGFQGLRRLLRSGDGKEPFSRGEDVREPGVLRHHGLAAGQVADRALAEPAASEAHVLVLR